MSDPFQPIVLVVYVVYGGFMPVFSRFCEDQAQPSLLAEVVDDDRDARRKIKEILKSHSQAALFLFALCFLHFVLLCFICFGYTMLYPDRDSDVALLEGQLTEPKICRFMSCKS